MGAATGTKSMKAGRGKWKKPNGFRYWECPVYLPDPEQEGQYLVAYARVGQSRNVAAQEAAIQRAEERVKRAYALARLGVNPYGNGVEGEFSRSRLDIVELARPAASSAFEQAYFDASS